jgi:RimJ/RimL family protein N-acetyltransferase
MPEADQVPAIDTERLSLRGHRLDDFGECAALWSDPIVTRYIGGRPFSEEETWTRLLRYIGHWSAIRFGSWVVRETSSGRFVGEVGFANYRRDIVPSLGATPEAGWVLSPSMHGRGYAVEAMRAVTAWGDQNLPSHRTVCLISPENLPSIRLAEKIGYGAVVHTTYHGAPTIIFERVVADDAA